MTKVGRVLKIGVKTYRPGSNACAKDDLVLESTEECSAPGHTNEVFAMMMEYLGTQYELIPFGDDVPWGAMDKTTGNYSGMLGMIENGTIDTTSIPWFYTE